MRRTWKEKRKDESGGEEKRRTKKRRPRCIRCLAETGDDGKNGDGGQLGKRDRREEERKECICGLLDRVGGRVRRLGRALRWWEPRPRERTQAGQPGADLDRRNIRTNGNSAYTYYRIYRREREKGREREKDGELTPRRGYGDTVGIRRSRAYVKYPSDTYTRANVYTCVYGCVDARLEYAHARI